MKATETVIIECEGKCKSLVQIHFEPFVRSAISKELIPERTVGFCPFCSSKKIKLIPMNEIVQISS